MKSYNIYRGTKRVSYGYSLARSLLLLLLLLLLQECPNSVLIVEVMSFHTNYVFNGIVCKIDLHRRFRFSKFQFLLLLEQNVLKARYSLLKNIPLEFRREA